MQPTRIQTAENGHNIVLIYIMDWIVFIKICLHPYIVNNNCNAPKLDVDWTEAVTVVAWADDFFVFLPLSTYLLIFYLFIFRSRWFIASVFMYIAQLQQILNYIINYTVVIILESRSVSNSV